MHVPMRTCVGCRHIRPQAELLRTHCLHGQPVPALRRRPAAVPADGPRSIGRAAYLCPSRSCLKQAARRGGFARTFQAGNVTADVDVLWAALSDEVNRESDLLQRSGAARTATSVDAPDMVTGTTTHGGQPGRIHRLLALAAAMRASGRGA